MRKLKVKDIAPAIKLAKAINCGDEIKNIARNTDDASKAGVEIIGLVLNKYAESPQIQIKVAEFLSGVFEMKPEEVANMDLDEFAQAIKEIGGLKAITNFFGNVLQ